MLINMEGNPFLKESWQRKAEGEKGLNTEENTPVGYEKDIKIFYELKKTINDLSGMDLNPEDEGNLRVMYHEVLDGAQKYVARILGYNKAKNKERIDREEMAEADDNRTKAHDALIDNLNALSRYMRKLGIDNSWRRDIGIDRKEVQRWAQNVMYHLQER